VSKKDFKAQVDKDAQQAALSHNTFAAQVKVQATFVDSPSAVATIRRDS
jgi:hypothetical protein